MKKFTSSEVRNIFLNFFKDKGHYIVPSASLIPIDDDSLLWINSGVATLKPYFEGREKPPSPRLVNSQKSIRTGDIENVGVTARHHTFFEMLGNFSIGDYFKEEAIEFAYEILTSKKYFAIPIDKLWITVFEDDSDALNKWIEIGFPKDRIFLMGRETNFWDMGKGPSGPSTEIFFDRGEKYNSNPASKLIKEDIENDRFIEIWNIVFSQFNNDGENNYTELPQKNIDTGAGLERFVSIFQDTPTNFETDLFRPIIEKISEISGKEYIWDYIPGQLDKKQEEIQRSMKAIADFTRTATFSIGDGVIPSNNGRGYVIRRLLRKAILFGIRLGIKGEFIYKLPKIVNSIMSDFYPELEDKLEIIEDKIKSEEIQFKKTLNNSKKLLLELMENNKGKTLPSEKIFELYETYGLPYEFIEEITMEQGFHISRKDFEKHLINFQEKSRENKKDQKGMNEQKMIFRGIKATKFIGYDEFESTSKVIAIEKNFVALDKTPFYATSGGQEYDKGKINGININGVFKNGDDVFIHELETCPNFKVDDMVIASIDQERRRKITMNHSAVHLTFAALEKVLNFSVPQVGSKIDEDSFRFDFVYHKELNDDILKKVEFEVNNWISKKVQTEVKEITLKEAKESNVTILEGTKYGEKVRVVKFDSITADLCGGTHIKNTKDLEEVVLVKFEKKGSGTFRLIGVSGKDNIEKINKEIRKMKISKIIKKIESMRPIILTPEFVLAKKLAINAIWNGKGNPEEYIIFLENSIEEINKSSIKKIGKSIMMKAIEKTKEEKTIIHCSFTDVDNKYISKNVIKKWIPKLENKILVLSNKDTFKNKANVWVLYGDKINFDSEEEIMLKLANDHLKLKGGGSNRLYRYGGSIEKIIVFAYEYQKEINENNK